MRGLILAIQFLTQLPTPRLHDSRADDQVRASFWFPFVGLLVGCLVTMALLLGTRIDPWLGALLSLLVWVKVTGALHLDGLCDLADALGAAHGDKNRLLNVLADPHVGAFGVVALVLQLLMKLVLLMLLAKWALFWPLILIPAWARWGALIWARLPSIKPGLGRHFALQCPLRVIAMWGVALLVGGLLNPALLAAPLLVIGWRAYLLARLDGMSGDALGAGVEWLESGLMLALVLTCASFG